MRHLPTPQFHRLFRHPYLVVFIVVGVIVIIAVAISMIMLHRPDKTQPTEQIRETPNFTTITPEGKSIDTFGGWIRISPPAAEPVFSYNDTLDDVNISVNEQPLPASFKNDPSTSVKDLATNFNATNELALNNTTAYLGTSSKGPQSVIFTKDNLLILIKSEKEIADTTWKRYISSLR